MRRTHHKHGCPTTLWSDLLCPSCFSLLLLTNNNVQLQRTNLLNTIRNVCSTNVHSQFTCPLTAGMWINILPARSPAVRLLSICNVYSTNGQNQFTCPLAVGTQISILPTRSPVVRLLSIYNVCSTNGQNQFTCPLAVDMQNHIHSPLDTVTASVGRAPGLCWVPPALLSVVSPRQAFQFISHQ